MAGEERLVKVGSARGCDERGAALIITLLAALLLTVLGAGVVLTSATDVRLAANHRDIREAFYAADAAAARAVAELRRQPDWNAVLAGAARLTFVDGPPGGPRAVAPGVTVVLDEIVNEADCGQAAACSGAQMDAVTSARPWGRNNPRWQLFAYGPAASLAVARRGDRAYYVVVLVGDDQAETDGDPARDGDAAASSPGAGVVVLRAQAFGASGFSQTVELTVARAASSGPAIAESAEADGNEGEEGDAQDRDAAAGNGFVIDASVPSWPPGSVRLLSWRWIR